MFLSMRDGTRERWRLRRLAKAALALSILVVACTGRNPEPNGATGSNAGSPLPPPETAAAAGGVAGQQDSTGERESDAGSSSGGAGDPLVEPEPAPGVDEPDVDEPDVVSPGVDEPDVDEPDVDEPPLDDDEPDRDALGLPCEVQSLLRKRCQGCHADPPVEGAFIPLLSYTDLTARSKIDSAVTVAARSVRRIKDSLRPMPPAPATPITVSELTPLQAWIDAGTPRGKCEQTPTADPYDASPACTSGKYWTAVDSGSPWMNPGRACIKCHRQYPSFAPLFSVAGTVFATAHEPDKCFGVPLEMGAQVMITDANGVELPPIRVVSGGNFNAIFNALSLPYRAKVVVGDQERVMLTPQTSGDCNACHTQTGSQGARGRVIVP